MLGLKTDTRPKTKICLEYVQVYICTTSKLKGDNLSPKSEGREKKTFTAHTKHNFYFYLYRVLKNGDKKITKYKCKTSNAL